MCVPNFKVISLTGIKTFHLKIKMSISYQVSRICHLEPINVCILFCANPSNSLQQFTEYVEICTCCWYQSGSPRSLGFSLQNNRYWCPIQQNPSKHYQDISTQAKNLNFMTLPEENCRDHRQQWDINIYIKIHGNPSDCCRIKVGTHYLSVPTSRAILLLKMLFKRWNTT